MIGFNAAARNRFCVPGYPIGGVGVSARREWLQVVAAQSIMLEFKCENVYWVFLQRPSEILKNRVLEKKKRTLFGNKLPVTADVGGRKKYANGRYSLLAPSLSGRAYYQVSAPSLRLPYHLRPACIAFSMLVLMTLLFLFCYFLFFCCCFFRLVVMLGISICIILASLVQTVALVLFEAATTM